MKNLLLACTFGIASACLAQTPAPEAARALVQRLSPAAAPFSAAIAGRLRVPPGFELQLFASGLGHPRMLDVGPDGTVYVTRRDRGDVLALADTDGDGRSDRQNTFAAGLKGVHGIAVRDGQMWLASSTTVWRTPLAAAAPQALIEGLPDGGQHANRMVRVAPDGALWVSVGSSCNDCAEDNQLERATLIRYSADGRERRVVANGLRNTIGYDWHPGTGALWGMDHGSDFRGDRLPPEELNRIEDGGHHGWPICYADRRVDRMTQARPEDLALQPGQAAPSKQPISREDFCARTVPAQLLAPAHAAPMAMRFIADPRWPAAWRGDALVAMRGSWNRGHPVGYAVWRIRFAADGRAQAFEPFVEGFVDAGEGRVYGRPVGIAFARDGALLVSDDTLGAIWRVVPSPR